MPFWGIEGRAPIAPGEAASVKMAAQWPGAHHARHSVAAMTAVTPPDTTVFGHSAPDLTSGAPQATLIWGLVAQEALC